jgi:hypothetical protein
VIDDAPDRERLIPVADIVATVELERALVASGRSPGLAATAVLDPLLGANVVVVDTADGRQVALAEPVAEGRLAASLARHGEGVVGRYLAVPEGDGVEAYRQRAGRAGVETTRAVDGPFGRSVLVLVRPVTGPHLIVVEPRSLPSRS